MYIGPRCIVWNRQLRFASALRPWLTETRGGSACKGSSFTGADICILFVPATSRIREPSLSPLSPLCGVLGSLMHVKLHDQTIRLHVRTVEKKHAVASGHPIKVAQQRRNVIWFHTPPRILKFPSSRWCATPSRSGGPCPKPRCRAPPKTVAGTISNHHLSNKTWCLNLCPSLQPQSADFCQTNLHRNQL